MIDLSEVLDGDEFSVDEGVVISRTAGDAYDNDGLFQKGTSSSFTLDGPSVQPASSEDVQVLPEGERSKEAINIYSLERLLPAISDQATGLEQAADIVGPWDGKTWKVMFSTNWGSNGYFHAIAVRLK